MAAQSNSWRFAVLAGLLFLGAAGCNGDQDDKDAVIERLNKQVALQQKHIELLEKQGKAQADFQKREIDLIDKQMKAMSDRYKQEIDLLNKTIREREKVIVKLEADIKTCRLQPIHEALPHRSTNEEVIGSEPKLPPVNGVIEKVDKDLVQISLGTDDGVRKNLVLDVYRVKPLAKYLGSIRIVDANSHKSVGRYVKKGDEAIPQFLEGDRVTSKLTKEEKKEKE